MTLAEQSDRNGGNFYLLTGKVIREWVKLELSLSLWLADLLGIDDLRSRILWDSYGDFNRKVNLLKTLIKNFTEERLWQEADEIFANVENLAECRYILAHMFGEVDEKASKISYISDKTDHEFVIDFVGEKEVVANDLNKWIKSIIENKRDIVEFKTKLGSAVCEKSLMHRRLSPG